MLPYFPATTGRMRGNYELKQELSEKSVQVEQSAESEGTEWVKRKTRVEDEGTI